MAAPAGAACANHPGTAAVDVCERCGTFICGGCLEIDPIHGGVMCGRCLERRGQKASGRAIASLILGIVGLQCGLLPGIVGLILATQELGAIERGESNEASKSMAKGGQILGFINVGLLLLIVIGVVIAVVVGASKRF